MLDKICKKVETGERLSAAEGEFLFQPEVDLHARGRVGRRGPPGAKTAMRSYYNLNAHLNPTNICVYRCALCAYSRDEDDPQAYAMDIDEMLKQGREAAEAGCTELHIVSGVHPEKPYDWYLEMIRPLHAAFPQNASEGLDGRGDRLVYAAHRPSDTGDIGRDASGGLGQHARRRSGNLRSADPHADLPAQGRRPDVARGASHRPSTRTALQRHHALRPHRRHRASHRPSGAVAASAGRRPADSRPLCRWHSIRKIRDLNHLRGRRRLWICG